MHRFPLISSNENRLNFDSNQPRENFFEMSSLSSIFSLLFLMSQTEHIQEPSDVCDEDKSIEVAGTFVIWKD